MSDLEIFRSRIVSEWLVPFCRSRGYDPAGFNDASLAKLSEADACDFMFAIDNKLVRYNNDYFHAACSQTKEQIFWECDRSCTPRKINLWLEPIITIAGLARLARDFGWPVSQLGMQSKTWAFDLVAYERDLITEHVLCGVKKKVHRGFRG